MSVLRSTLDITSDLQLTVGNAKVSITGAQNTLFINLANPLMAPSLLSSLPSLKYCTFAAEKLVSVMKLFNVNVVIQLAGMSIMSLKASDPLLTSDVVMQYLNKLHHAQ